MYKLFPLVALLASCGNDALLTSTPSPANPSSGPDSCNAAQFGGLIGQPIGDGGPLLESGAVYRVVYPGSAVTLELDPERINVNVDDDGIVQSMNCG